MKNAAQAQLDSLSNSNPAEGVRMAHRLRMLEAFLDFKGKDNADTVLDISGGMPAGHLYYEREKLQAKNTATYEVQQGALNGKRLPFQDQSFDWAYCNGVIENAGNSKEQFEFLEELWRIARKGVFLTTSNKKHFIEFNTGVPLLHWLPKSLWRRSLKSLGKDNSATLNLLDAPALEALAHKLPGSPLAEIGHIRFAVLKAHFFLMIRK